MGLSWGHPAGLLVERADTGWAGIWSLTFAAGAAATRLAAVPGADEDLAWLHVGFDLNTVMGVVEAVHPEVLTSAPAVDLGTVEVADGHAATRVVVALVDAAIGRVAALTGTPGLSMRELLVLAEVAPVLLAAREKATGRGSW